MRPTLSFERDKLSHLDDIHPHHLAAPLVVKYYQCHVIYYESCQNSQVTGKIKELLQSIKLVEELIQVGIQSLMKIVLW